MMLSSLGSPSLNYPTRISEPNFYFGTYSPPDTPIVHLLIVSIVGGCLACVKKHPALILTINQHQQGVTTNGSYRAPNKSRPKTRRRIPWQVSWLAGPRLLPTFPGWSRVAFSGSCLTAHSCGYSRRSDLKISPALLRSLLFPGYSPLWETTEDEDATKSKRV